MASTPSLTLALGGVFLVTWYGWRQMHRKNGGRPRPPQPGTVEYCQSASVALAAEFYEPPVAQADFPGGAVLCQDCGATYPAGQLYCECGGENQEPDELAEEGSHGNTTASVRELDETQLVCIYVAESSWKAFLLRSFLESHDIACVTKGTVASGLLNFHYMGAEEVRILVSSEDACHASELIRRSQEN